MNNDEIGRKLDAIAAILKLVNHEQLDAARQRIRGDKIYAAILDSTKDWTGAAKLQTAAAKKGSARSTRGVHKLSRKARAGRRRSVCWEAG